MQFRSSPQPTPAPGGKHMAVSLLLLFLLVVMDVQSQGFFSIIETEDNYFLSHKLKIKEGGQIYVRSAAGSHEHLFKVKKKPGSEPGFKQMTPTERQAWLKEILLASSESEAKATILKQERDKKKQTKSRVRVKEGTKCPARNLLGLIGKSGKCLPLDLFLSVKSDVCYVSLGSTSIAENMYEEKENTGNRTKSTWSFSRSQNVREVCRREDGFPCEDASSTDTCAEGLRYKEVVVGQCVDVDECAEKISGCAAGCENTFGSFRCTCPDGFVLMSDQKTCLEKDECAIGEHDEPIVQ